MVGPRKQDFWPKISILKGNHCILRIQGAPVRQNLGMILENKVVQKLKLEIFFWSFMKFLPFCFRKSKVLCSQIFGFG